jgi:hypothetical protein
MPKLLWSSEKLGCGATIELDTKEVVIVSIARTGVLVRLTNKNFMGSFFGPKLYNESNVYKMSKRH